ncbi:O-acetyl-ADP-ribose deacetylase [Siminovitchia acidinfaciens]|uniref:O-acetyl-ADP-ribose deacetylase n=1 Tax=Siminovitchia acidinfaciens TaxID=2321395 RepID=A0A429XSX5_9BACI|nr:O-acetyl-ADP-ribose deacetylase [Siminovitchia acidinfaciens]RST70316.1 O-acetyl-ADP-ribose deacetylase [Siminovitchia acidinfaciens]
MKISINGNTLELKIGDITKQTTDAIVNAAIGTLLGGGGVDGAIHRAAGPELLEECKKVRRDLLEGELLATGKAVITGGYNLASKHVIHTVGPVWHGGANQEEKLLADCYRNSLQLAAANNIKSISFPSISTGVYRFPVELASEIALRSIREFLNEGRFGDVTMMLFSDIDFGKFQSSLEKLVQQ